VERWSWSQLGGVVCQRHRSRRFLIESAVCRKVDVCCNCDKWQLVVGPLQTRRRRKNGVARHSPIEAMTTCLREAAPEAEAELSPAERRC
jgi:hypothetical protein